MPRNKSHPLSLSPSPPQMDAKNSPLALLAQTCSSIGADSTPNPKLLANIEKSTKSSSSTSSNSSSSSLNGLNLSKTTMTTTAAASTTNNGHHDSDKLSPAGHSNGSSSSSDLPAKSSFKPYELPAHQPKAEEAQHQRSSSAKSMKLHRSESNQSASSQRASPAAAHPKQGGSPHMHHSNGLATSPPPRASSKDSGLSSSLENSSSTSGSASKPTSYSSYSSESAKDMPAFHPLSAHPSFLGGGPGGVSSSAFPSSAALAASAYLNGAAAAAGYSPYAMDMAMAHHQQMMKAAAMNPYYSSYPMSRPSPHSMMQVCRDPYCTGCALSNHHRLMNPSAAAAAVAASVAASTPTSKGACPIGCTQCDHVPTSAAALMSSVAQSAAAATTTTYSSNSKLSPYPSVSQSSAAYAHAQLSALAAATQLPFVCNWIATDASYCGKRFGTSDDLLQHLRTHTSNMSESMLTTAAATGLPPTHPLLQRSYPTPPLSPLSTARYHPYGKPPSLLPPPPPGAQGYNPLAGLHPGMAPHPSLAQYFSPFSLYGMPRLGAHPSMHQ